MIWIMDLDSDQFSNLHITQKLMVGEPSGNIYSNSSSSNIMLFKMSTYIIIVVVVCDVRWVASYLPAVVWWPAVHTAAAEDFPGCSHSLPGR